MDTIMQELSPEGVFIVTRAPDREAAEGLLKKAKNGHRGGIWFHNGTLTITDSIISNNRAGDNSPSASGGGIYFVDGTLNISNSSITDNIQHPNTGLSYNSIYIGSTLNARYNWWGSPTGPYHTTNTNGTGNSILGSGVVYEDFYPWLMSDPFSTAETATDTEPEEEIWIRNHEMTCYQVWINEDNNFEFVFWWEYKNNNWVKIYDMEDSEVFSIDMEKGSAHFEADLTDGMYTVRTFHDDYENPIQEFLIGKP